MTLVKVIDSTTWAGLTEIDISESDDLSASLVNGTYRLIHSATTTLVVAAVTLVSGAPASISMTAYAATVETPSAAVTVTSASPAAITMTAYGATVSIDGGGTTRRKLVSTSNSANTGMHSTSTITMAADDVTVAFWWRPTNESTNNGRTLFAGHAGQYQVYTGAGTAQNIRNLIARMDGTIASTITTQITAINTWFHVCIHFGQNHSGGTDVEVYINGSSVATVTGAGSSTEMTTAGTHYILGDDASGSASDDGCIGEIFDFCMMDGIIGVTDTNYNGGSWQDLTSTGLAALKYRIDGQNAGDPGEDSSGNGHDFTVESSGVTLSDTSLPTGANP